MDTIHFSLEVHVSCPSHHKYKQAKTIEMKKKEKAENEGIASCVYAS